MFPSLNKLSALVTFPDAGGGGGGGGGGNTVWEITG